jgi:hypothetical protein
MVRGGILMVCKEGEADWQEQLDTANMGGGRGREDDELTKPNTMIRRHYLERDFLLSANACPRVKVDWMVG